jgi:hypothetical protein
MVINQRGGDPTKCRAELQKVIALNPSHAEALTMLAVTEAQSGNKKDALKYAQRAVQLGPRNEYYISNLVFAQLQNEMYDEAEPNLKLLAESTNPGIVETAQRNLQQLQQMKQWKQQEAARMKEQEARAIENAKAYEDNVARLTKAADSGTSAGKRKIIHVDQVPDAGAEEVHVLPSQPGGYAKGTLTAVECDGDAATLHVTASGKALNLQVKDVHRVVVINADAFSCGWKNRVVGVNFAGATNSVISIELY